MNHPQETRRVLPSSLDPSVETNVGAHDELVSPQTSPNGEVPVAAKMNSLKRNRPSSCVAHVQPVKS